MASNISQASLFFEALPADDNEAFQYLEGLLDGSLNEAEWLDFKNGKDIPNDKVRAIWSKALSGFATSGGGIVIWGIQTKSVDHQDIPENLALVDNPAKLVGLLTTHLRDAVDPPVLGVKSCIVSRDGKEGFVVCYIPSSDLKPHRAEVQEIFYIRAGHQHVAASPTLLRQLFFPHTRPVMELSIDAFDGGPSRGFDVVIRVKNKGLSSLEDLFVVVSGDEVLPLFVPGEDFQKIDTDLVQQPEYANLESSRKIHPRMQSTIGRMKLFSGSKIHVSIFGKDIEPLTWRFSLAEGKPAGTINLDGPIAIPGSFD